MVIATYVANITGAISLSGYYAEYDLPILITDINCTGSELSFLNCAYNTLSNHTCSRYNDGASVICQRKQLNNYSLLSQQTFHLYTLWRAI